MSFIASLGDWLRKITRSFASASISGQNITLTRHNGDTVVLTTQDTVNNAFTKIKLGTVTLEPDAVDDTLTLGVGAGIQLSANATNDSITVSGVEATQSVAGIMSTTDKTKLDGIATGAEVNQNTFSNVKVGSTTVAADAKTDTFELVAGNNVTITPDATNDKITIAATDTTYSNATTSAAGLMSKDDKTKLNGIATGAEVNQNAFSNIKVSSTTIAADSKTDTLELVAGSNVTLIPDATNDKVTIAATNTTYTAASETPKALVGAGVVGTSAKYAREDHVHPIEFSSVYQPTSASDLWYKVASYTVPGIYQNYECMLLVEDPYENLYGILYITVRSDGSRNVVIGTTSYQSKLRWLINSGFNIANFVFLVPSTTPSTAELWIKRPHNSSNHYYIFTKLSQGTRSGRSAVWNFETSPSGQSSLPTGVTGTPFQSIGDNIAYRPGDTFNILTNTYSGYITANKTEIQMTIPLSKYCSSGTYTVTFTAFDIRATGNTNIIGGLSLISNVTAGITESGLRIRVYLSSALSGVNNNSPVAINAAGTCVIT